MFTENNKNFVILQKKCILYGIGRIRVFLAWIKLHDGMNIVLGRHIQNNDNFTKRKLYKMYFIVIEIYLQGDSMRHALLRKRY